MADVKEIKTLLKEAQLYQTQGLLKEAKKRYESALSLVEEEDSIQNREQLLDGINKKIQSLEAVTYRVEKKTHITEISPRDKDLIKRLFSTTATDDNDTAMLEGAVALAKFGQFDRAISEFEDLLEESPLRIVAAKHILRCHMAMRTLHDPVLQFQKWVTTGYFEKEELGELSTFLERTYGLSVADQGEASPVPQAPAAPAAPPPDTTSPPTAPETGPSEESPETLGFDPYEDDYVDVLGNMNGAPGEDSAEASESEGYIDILGDQNRKKTIQYDDILTGDSDDYVDYISSVGIPLANGDVATIPVNLQTGSVANLIIPGDQKLVIERMKKGARIEDTQLNSPISKNIGKCTVVAVARIDMGPKKGDYSVDLKIEG